MMAEKISLKRIPKLRFPEFTDNWEEKFVKNIAPLQRGFDLPVSTIEEGKYPVVFSNGILKTHSEYKAKGPGVVTGRSGTIGKVTYVENDYWPHNTALWVTDFYKNNPKFIYYFYIKFDLVRFGGGSGVPTLNRNDVHAQKRFIPSLPEQQKIAAFLSAVDKKIQQLTRKKELLQQYKKGVMQKIFSREIRFTDDNGQAFPEWEEKRLGEISSIKRGALPRPITDSKWFDLESKIGWVRISDVTSSNKYLEKTVQYLSDAGVQKSRLIKTGSMIMSICATIGKPIYTKFPVCIHDGFVVFESLKADKEYLFYYLDYIQKRWYRYGQPGTQVNLNTEIVGSEYIPYPCIDEQKKIASFFSIIDKKIEIIQSQLSQTQSFKKGLLQRMFV